MADVLTIASRTALHQIDLLAGTYKLRDGTWSTSTPQVSSDLISVPYGLHSEFQSFLPQVETIDLIAQNTTHSTITAAQKAITDALECARLYNQHPLWTLQDTTEGGESVWLQWNINGESAKQSLIYEGSLSGINEQCAEPFISSNVSLLRLAITRHPFWENTSTTSTYPTAISSWGGTYNFNNIPGNVWARLWQMRLAGTSGSGPVYQTWMGIREEMAGTTNFEPIWELEDGGLVGGTVSSTSRSNYSGSGHARKSSPASSLTKYIEITVNDVCTANGHSDYDEQMGEYLVLCRCAVDSGTVGLQMRFGYADSTTAPSEEVFISHNLWKLVELGRIKIPPIEYMGTSSNYLRYIVIEIYAEQVTGTSVLDLDSLCLIPTHHFWRASGANIRDSLNYSADIYTTPNDQYTCFGRTANYPRDILEYNTENWYLPAGNSIAVVAGERYAQHVLADDVVISSGYIPRWGMYR